MKKLSVKTVPFMGDELTAAKSEETGKVFVGVSYICKGIGLSEGQRLRQVTNVQSDAVLSKGSCKFDRGVFDPNNETIALDIDFLLLWLAKITITPNMQKEQPNVADKLIQYQLKAKDVLAAAFIPKAKPYSAVEMLKLQSQAIVELDDRVSVVEDKLDNQMTIDHAKQRTLQNIIAQKVYQRIQTNFLSGGESNIRECSSRYFKSIYKDLKNRFGVASYRDIKISDYDIATAYVSAWVEPANIRGDVA